MALTKSPALLAQMTETSDMSLLQEVINQPFESADLDWSDFLAWRLALEQSLIREGRENEWLSLYDTSVESARLAAYARFNEGGRGAILPDHRPLGLVRVRMARRNCGPQRN